MEFATDPAAGNNTGLRQAVDAFGVKFLQKIALPMYKDWADKDYLL